MSESKSNSNAVEALAGLYHSWITGLVLTILNRRDARLAEEFVFRLFRRQHLERFLPGLQKLGLADEPHAVAAAKYHYFSNQLGGVSVEYLEESDTKAWVRYPPPRWMWMGTALCAIPTEVNRAMLRGWHAHNGVTLGNPNLGFVCTKTTVDGQPGLEGYYREFPAPLDAHERLRFAPEEVCPYIEPADLPTLDVDAWPDERRAKAYRNYSMEYIRNALPVLSELVGPEEARYLGRISALQIGMHSHREIAATLDVDDDSATSFLTLLATLLAAHGDDVHLEDGFVEQRTWRLFPEGAHDAVSASWIALWEGLLAAHNRFLAIRVIPHGQGFRWELVEGRG
jgi:hypothetical protein